MQGLTALEYSDIAAYGAGGMAIRRRLGGMY